MQRAQHHQPFLCRTTPRLAPPRPAAGLPVVDAHLVRIVVPEIPRPTHNVADQRARRRSLDARGGSIGMTARLRLVVFTSGSLAPVNRVFFERLAEDPFLDLAAIIVDEYRQPRRPLLARIVNAVREDGLPWLAF